MRFLIHGAVSPDVAAALVRHEHVCHTMAEVADGTEDAGPDESDAGELLVLLGKKQWHVVTDDGELVQSVYERKLAFEGIIVMILGDGDKAQDGGNAIDRLFERYKRLTPGRLYTVTPNRVKIRQLPGANM